MKTRRLEIVKDSPELVRDSFSNAILNRDNKALLEYKEKQKKRLEQKNQILQCQDDINTLKNEIKDIKDMFGQILNKLDSKEK